VRIENDLLQIHLGPAHPQAVKEAKIGACQVSHGFILHGNFMAPTLLAK
jgi:hypothetical protein